jgi:hypothetical protein
MTPKEALKEYDMENEATKYMEEMDKVYSFDDTVKTFEYVKQECENLYEQLVKLNMEEKEE